LKAVPLLLAVVALAACGGEDQKSSSQRAPKGDPGLKVWAAQGCGSCHTFGPAGSTATIGPNLGNSLGGRSRDYIRESIVAPNAKVGGGGTSIMPEGFAKRMSKSELDALVEFIAKGVRAH
jgi:mono/diheme cytochrome c family protein